MIQVKSRDRSKSTQSKLMINRSTRVHSQIALNRNITLQQESQEYLCPNCANLKLQTKTLIEEMELEISRLRKKNHQLEQICQFKETTLENGQKQMLFMGLKIKQQNEQNTNLNNKINIIKNQTEERQNFVTKLLDGVQFHVNGKDVSEQQTQFQMSKPLSSRLTTRTLVKMIGDDNTQRFKGKSMNFIKNARFYGENLSEMQNIDNILDQRIQTQNSKMQTQHSSEKQQNVKIVCQFMQADKSFFTDHNGKFSFFQDNENQRKIAMDQINLIEEIFKNENQFTIKLNALSPLQQHKIIQDVQIAIADLKHFTQISWQLKKLLEVTMMMMKQTNLQDAYESIIKLSRTYLKCDRFSIFILNEFHQILWTKANESNLLIEVPANKGIVGFSVTNNKKINVVDAYKDERFNQDIDRKTGYKTKSILVVPITDLNNKVTGAIQAINKFDGAFNQDDEEVTAIIAQFAGGIIKNSIIFQENMAIKFYSINGIEDTIQYVHKQIQDIMVVQRSIILLVKSKDSTYNQCEIKKYHQIVEIGKIINSTESFLIPTENQNSLISQVLGSIIFSQTYQLDKSFNYCHKPRKDHNYNPLVDLDTTLSLLTIPVINQKDDHIIAIVQIEAVKELVYRFLKTHKIDDFELLKMFLVIFGHVLEAKFRYLFN